MVLQYVPHLVGVGVDCGVAGMERYCVALVEC